MCAELPSVRRQILSLPLSSSSPQGLHAIDSRQQPLGGALLFSLDKQALSRALAFKSGAIKLMHSPSDSLFFSGNLSFLPPLFLPPLLSWLQLHHCHPLHRTNIRCKERVPLLSQFFTQRRHEQSAIGAACLVLGLVVVVECR